MTDLNFHGLKNVSVDLTDLEEGIFTPPAELPARVAKPGDEIWHVVASEWVRGAAAGQSVIQREWSRGAEVWQTAGFAVLVEKGEPLSIADLPPKHKLITHPAYIPSGSIRMMLSQGEPVRGQLVDAVESYIRRHGLFRDVPLSETICARPEAPQFHFHVDEMNPTSRDYAERWKQYESDNPKMIVSIGGDGTMLRAIRKHWRDRLPFIGINTGGLGFLLSGRELVEFWHEDLLVYHLPLLRVKMEFHSGAVAESYAFNDAWVERATGQTAWVRVSVNGTERVPRLIADGVLVSTAAGSNSYARAMGATPVPLSTDVLTLVGSNVLKPVFWKPVVLPLDSEIVLECVDCVRRPLQGYIDGEAFAEPVRRMSIRVSRTAAVELAFTKEQDPVKKLGFVQFPKELN
jgi:NAD kinase